MTRFVQLFLCLSLLMGSTATHAERLLIAAAADLKFAMDEIVVAFLKAHPGRTVDVVYGSSGKFHTQIQQGGPYDLFFSADIAFPHMLVANGHAAAPVSPYAVGRIVLWSNTMDASKMTLRDLTDSKITRIAIANPKHAPYGKRAVEALQAAGVWPQVEPKLIYGENIAQTAQFVQTGNAQVGILALALVLNPRLSDKGRHWLIPDQLHEPLEQGFVITRHAKDKALAKQFADFMATPSARAVLRRYGFALPGEASASSR
ncbi:MAG: molybdate ABC transporter substrate-binding protein [Aquabacterium sp.]